MLHRRQHAARLRLRRGGDLVHGGHARRGHARPLKTPQQLVRGHRPRDPGQGLLQRHAVLHAPRIVHEARIAGQRRHVEGGGRLHEEGVRAGRDHDPAVHDREGLVRHDHRGARALRPRDLAGGEVVAHLEDRPGERGVEERGGDLGAMAGAVALAQGGEDAHHRPHARAHVHHRDRHARGRLIGMAVDGHDAAVGLHQRIVPGPVLERALGAERGDRAVDQAGVEPGDPCVAQPQLLRGAGAQRLHEDVGAAEQALDHRAPLVGLEIDREAPLVAVDAHEGGALLPPEGRPPRARVVAPAEALHLHDLRAEVAQDLGAVRARHVLGEIGDEQAGEGRVHGGLIIARSVITLSPVGRGQGEGPGGEGPRRPPGGPRGTSRAPGWRPSPSRAARPPRRSSGPGS
jgi:hypothetical protein